MDIRALLEADFSDRRRRNPRHSLRQFARTLGTHHSTLSQLLQARRRLTSRTIRQLGERLGLTRAQIHEACVAEHCATILRLSQDPRFRADSRWIAVMAGIPLDDVNVALQWLLFTGRLTLSGPGTWKRTEGLSA